ncbi:ras-related protein Rap1-like [Haliotis rufescens]|uniref:ras-related protein Rap1-like n=1 Tax=Haliotis rufescens TaxID=6454 RepID=UPI001EB0AD44|nr:ras-related protein Rap1-like [Haliotis rufescens]XP_048248788.1 ras-related protein Rap1-like [Haliotis rufescens]
MTDAEQRNRVVLLGAGGVGKSSILKRFLFNTFTEEYKETVEDLYCREYDLHGTSIKVDFLDTAGNFAFPAMRKLSMSTAHGFILVYSITSQASFDELKKLWEQIKEERTNFQDIPIAIVGNKVDMENDRQIEKFDTLNWIYSEGFCGGFVEVSAKEDESISDIFRILLDQSRGGVHRHFEPIANRRVSTNSLDETETEKAEEWDSDAKKFNRSRSLIRRGSKPRMKRSPRHHGKNDCVLS